MSARPFAELLRLVAQLDVASSDTAAELVAQVQAEARRVLPGLAPVDEQAWLIEESDDYGVWDPVVVVLGSEARARELLAAYQGEDDEDDEPRFSMDTIGIRR